MGRPIKWSFQPDKRHEAIAKDACGGYEKLKADIAEKEKMPFIRLKTPLNRSSHRLVPLLETRIHGQPLSRSVPRLIICTK